MTTRAVSLHIPKNVLFQTQSSREAVGCRLQNSRYLDSASPLNIVMSGVAFSKKILSLWRSLWSLAIYGI